MKTRLVVSRTGVAIFSIEQEIIKIKKMLIIVKALFFRENSS